MIKVLGIETSCDETAVSIVTEEKTILANLVKSQIDIHRPYGGVVPEIAARSHIEFIGELIYLAQEESGVALASLDAIAVTSGPGLIGGLIVGLMTAKGIAHALNKPLIEVNHLEGHSLAARLTSDLEFPYLLLLISGGHCQILIVEDVSTYELFGATHDDALGEAFDKLAKMLGLNYPGGPEIERIARYGDENKFKLPRAMIGREGCDFSFSGIKTALRNIIKKEEEQNGLSDEFKADLAASFQKTICAILNDRLINSFALYSKKYPFAKRLVISGGVAANNYIRTNLESMAKKYGFELVFPPLKLCTDNAAMIAWAGLERFKKGYISNLQIEAKARWPLEDLKP